MALYEWCQSQDWYLCSNTQTGWLLSSTHSVLYVICIKKHSSCNYLHILKQMCFFDNTVQHGIMVNFALITPGIREKSFNNFAFWVLEQFGVYSLLLFAPFLMFVWSFNQILTSVFLDCELFIFDILQDEELSTDAHEARKILLRNFFVIQKRWKNRSMFNSCDHTLRVDTRIKHDPVCINQETKCKFSLEANTWGSFFQ